MNDLPFVNGYRLLSLEGASTYLLDVKRNAMEFYKKNGNLEKNRYSFENSKIMDILNKNEFKVCNKIEPVWLNDFLKINFFNLPSFPIVLTNGFYDSSVTYNICEDKLENAEPFDFKSCNFEDAGDFDDINKIGSLAKFENPVYRNVGDKVSHSVYNKVLNQSFNNPFLALNTAYINDILYIKIKKNIELDKPIHIIHILKGKENAASFPRVYIDAEENSKAEIIESFLSFYSDKDLKFLSNYVFEADVKKSAKINHYRIFDNLENFSFLNYSYVKLNEKSSYNNFFYAFDKINYLRNETDLEIDGDNTESNLFGAYHLKEGDIENIFRSHFKGKNSKSSHILKGVLENESNSSLLSQSIIAPDAKGNVSNQMHKVLMLSPKSKVFSRPVLDIFNDDVKADHGAASSYIKENDIFYLMQRGLSKKKAEEMIKYSFLIDIINETKNQDIKNYLLDFLE